MQIIKNRAIINDEWKFIDDDYEGNFDAVILSLARWREIRDNDARITKKIGVVLQPEDEVEIIVSDLNRINLIALAFGSFHEGRGYSQAAQLRYEYHFGGEIRALGAHRDNLPLMERCGINAYQLAAGENINDALLSFDEITAYYPNNEANENYLTARLTPTA